MDSKKTQAFERYAHFSKLVTHMPMIFYVLDRNWVFLVSDGEGLHSIGLKPGEAVGQSAKEMYRDYPDIIESITEAFKGRTVKYVHNIVGRHLENYLAPIYDDSGSIEGVIGATIDITERDQKEEELNRSQALQKVLIETVPGMIYMYDDKSELIFWNKWHEIMTGYSGDELLGFHQMDWFPEDDPESRQAILRGMADTAQKGFGTAEAFIRRKDGSRFPAYFTACPLSLDGKDYFIGMGLDVSDRVMTERKLLELNRSLEEKVDERTRELKLVNENLTAANEELLGKNREVQAVNEALTASNQKLISMQKFLVESEKMAALGKLVAGVAHEANTPIGVGLTASSHLADITQELLSIRKDRPLQDADIAAFLEDLDKASKIIFKNLNRAANLIQSFKKLSVDQSTEPKRTFELGAYIDEILLSLSPSLKKTQIMITTSCPEKVMMNAYPGSIAQIITNMVMNSLKHAYGPGDVGHIRIETTKTDSMVRIIFSDDGRGMDESTRNMIFEPFFTTDRINGGTGLGLSIVYSIVTQQYMGSIECASAPGKGTVFTIQMRSDVI